MKRIATTLFIVCAVMCCFFANSAFAASSDADLNPTYLLNLVNERKWAGVAAVVIYGLVRLFKSDTKIVPTIPPRLRIWFAFALGLASMFADKLAEGVTWQVAAQNMFASLFIAIVIFHETIIASIREGKEIVVPGLTIPGARPQPSAPATIPPPAEPVAAPPADKV